MAHAQFESIHPFTVIRYRGIARHVVIPTASALVAQREWYFAALDAYRAGRPRAGTAAARLVDDLVAEPIFTTEEVERRLGIPAASAYRAVERLVSAGIGLDGRGRVDSVRAFVGEAAPHVDHPLLGGDVRGAQRVAGPVVGQ